MATESLNFVTVCTDRYPMAYAAILTERLKQLSGLSIEPYCLTDRPAETEGWATPLPQFVKADGWWNKVNLFSQDMPAGTWLYLDLDIVLVKNFDDEIRWVIEHMDTLAAVSDPITWMDEKFSSSMMVFKAHQHTHVFDAFKAQSAELKDRAGGDQVWMGPKLGEVLYIDETFPSLKRNLKFHIAQKKGNTLDLPLTIPPDVKMVDCTGEPKPHQLEQLPYIKANWHDVLAAMQQA